MIIEGAISVKSAILNHERHISVVYMDVDKKTRDFAYIKRICRNNNIECKLLKKEELLDIASGKTFGGVLAEVTDRINDEFDEGDIFYLDGIEDPFNLGYSLRTLYAFGIRNVLLSKRDYANMQSQLLKSSAGAYDMLNVSICEDELNEIKAYKNSGYYLYGLFRGEDAKDIFDVKFEDKALFMLGGEKRGISSELLDLCDKHLYISYGSDFKNALNACAALDVCATLLYKQRKEK